MLFILFTKRRYVLILNGVVVVFGLNTTKLIFQKRKVLFCGNCKIDHIGHEGMLLILFTTKIILYAFNFFKGQPKLIFFIPSTEYVHIV